MGGSDLVQGGKPAEPELGGCVVSSEKVWEPSQARPWVMSCREEPTPHGPMGTRGFRNLLGVPVSLRDSVAGPQDTLPEQICDLLAWAS